MKLFKTRGMRCVEDVRDKAYVEIENFGKEILERTNWNFDKMSELDRLKVEIEEKDELIKTLKEENKKLFEYLGKVTELVQDKVEDLQSDRYLKVELKPDKAKSNQKIGSKSTARTAKRSAIAKAQTEVKDEQ